MNKLFEINKFQLLKSSTVLIILITGMIIWNWCSANTVLPPPPNVGSQNFNANDPIGYLIGSIRFVIFLGLTIVVVFALIGFSSGLIAEVNEARKKGEWGRFSIYFAAGLLVILVVIFGAWWGSERLSTMLTI